MKKAIFLVVFLAALVGLTWHIWHLGPKPEPPESNPAVEVPVHVGKITRATLHSYVTAYGAVEAEPAGQRPAASAHIAPTSPGVVAEAKCAEGQRVNKGDVLFLMDSRAADVAVDFAQKTLERQQKLVQVEGASQKTLQDAEQALAAAKAQKAQLQVQSPLSGVVTKVNTRAGEAADLTTVMAEVVDLDRLVVSVNVSIADLAAVKIGQPAELLSPDSTNILHAPVAYISPEVDSKTGSGLVRVSVPASSKWRPGQFIKLRIVTAEHQNCLTVPATSVAKAPNGRTFIATVDGDKAVRTLVKVGLREGDQVEVAGDGDVEEKAVVADGSVVTEGAYSILMSDADASKIRVLND
jgi:membrane fusion protein, multidrug efflux system